MVDFGGGTLDVALLDQHGLRDPWGDPTLGGRLFDDLFFQWLLDQNPGKADRSGRRHVRLAAHLPRAEGGLLPPMGPDGADR